MPAHLTAGVAKSCRCYGLAQTQRVNMIAGLCNNQIIAPIIFEGNGDTRVFESYIEQILIKALKPKQVVVMDNIHFHKIPKVKTLIESVDCTVLFLPTYSPNLNPIEHHWFKIKHQIRKIAINFTYFFEVVIYVLSLS